ncbi:hypothetical protein TrLO_g2763 [Triparma laevis f. longispina]|uniref:Polysaccharide biosynthesis domain-containing protein n=1 Tax=Triparma laevis f. longispina TaxID=1714387 RepID=A0A9W7FUN2_9STRA|nr:hypothetical protein TrLO_g2763 [Triparma laevis f. longispina]
MRSRSPNSPLKTSAAAQDPPRISSKVWRKTSWFKRRRHRLKLAIIFFLFVYFFAWIGVFVWVGGGSDLYDVDHAARLKNTRGVPPPIDMQMGLSQIGNILNFLPRTGNLLVFGLGNDSFYWHDVTKGTVSFIEGDFPDSKWATEWFDKVMEKYPYLDCNKVDYTTKMDRDYLRIISGGERLWAMELNLAKQLPRYISTTKWDVIIVDAPRGNKGSRGPGRFQSIYTARVLAREGTTIVIDDYDREIESRFSRLVLGREPVKVEYRPERKWVADANAQAYFEF